jgi:multicomponent Na+:H+ antiporter subunit F
MMEMAVKLALLLLSLSILGNLYRMLKGPSMPDRVIALDAVGINLLALIAMVSIAAGTRVYLDLVLLIGILAFLGTAAFARYLERGVVMEVDPDHRDPQ